MIQNAYPEVCALQIRAITQCGRMERDHGHTVVYRERPTSISSHRTRWILQIQNALRQSRERSVGARGDRAPRGLDVQSLSTATMLQLDTLVTLLLRSLPLTVDPLGFALEYPVVDAVPLQRAVQPG